MENVDRAAEALEDIRRSLRRAGIVFMLVVIGVAGYFIVRHDLDVKAAEERRTACKGRVLDRYKDGGSLNRQIAEADACLHLR
jgi:hypothetical protein